MSIGFRERSRRFEQPSQSMMGLRVRRLSGKDFTVGRDGPCRVAFLKRANLSQSLEQGLSRRLPRTRQSI